MKAGRSADEGPQHGVKIPAPIAVGAHEVTRGQFAAFVEETGYDAKGCYVFAEGSFGYDAEKSWQDPGFEQTVDHPVACVSHDDATAYTKWLSEKTDQTYRLLSESEWEYVARAGMQTRFWWGDDEPVSKQANFMGTVGRTTEIQSYPSNPFGLYDTAGNVWEWTQDCWNNSYQGAPDDGGAWLEGDCEARVLRGGAWGSGPGNLRSANRSWNRPGGRTYFFGFRVARTL